MKMISGIGSDTRYPTGENRESAKKGFTLTELLIAVTIFAVVNLAVYSTFNSGMSIWRRIEKSNRKGLTNLMRIEKINRELRQMPVLNAVIPFSGTKNTLSFPAVIASQINNVSYVFDADKKMLYRAVDKSEDILNAVKDGETLEPRFASYLNGVNELSFSYFYFDLQKVSYQWKEDWQEAGLPIAVKLNIAIGDETYTSTIFIPVA